VRICRIDISLAHANPPALPGFAAVTAAGPEEAYQPEQPDSLSERAVTLFFPLRAHPHTPVPDPILHLELGHQMLGMVRVGHSPTSRNPSPPTATWPASRMLCCALGEKGRGIERGEDSASRVLVHFPPIRTCFFSLSLLGLACLPCWSNEIFLAHLVCAIQCLSVLSSS